MYTDLRVMFEKISRRTCTSCQQSYGQQEGTVTQAQVDGKYVSLIACPKCGEQEPYYSRTHFSYNKTEGACPTCSGIGEEIQIHWPAIVDETKSVTDGALLYLDKGYHFLSYPSDSRCVVIF